MKKIILYGLVLVLIIGIADAGFWNTGVDALRGVYCHLTGCTLTGDLTVETNVIIGTGTEWLRIYLDGIIVYFNSSYKIMFTNDVEMNKTLNVSNITTSIIKTDSDNLTLSPASGLTKVIGNLTYDSYYGEMWYDNSTVYETVTFSSQNVWYQITGFDDHQNGQTLIGFTYASNALTCLINGWYRMEYTISAGNVGNNQEYIYVLEVNGILENKTASHRKIQTNGDVGNSKGKGYLRCNIGETIKLFAINKDGTADLQVHSVNVDAKWASI